MDIMINMKRMGKRRNDIVRTPFHLEHWPATVGELLDETVKTCVREYRERQPDLRQAKERARQAFEDGIAVIFINGQEQEHLTDHITITPGSDITFVKMTLLAGRMW